MRPRFGVTRLETMVAMCVFAITLGGAGSAFRSLEQLAVEATVIGTVDGKTVSAALEARVEQVLRGGPVVIRRIDADRIVLDHAVGADPKRTELFLTPDSSTVRDDDYRLFAQRTGETPLLLAAGLVRPEVGSFFARLHREAANGFRLHFGLVEGAGTVTRNLRFVLFDVEPLGAVAEGSPTP